MTDLRSSASTLGVRKLLVTAYGMQVVHGHDARACVPEAGGDTVGSLGPSLVHKLIR